jgi:chromosome segregation ATPase
MEHADEATSVQQFNDEVKERNNDNKRLLREINLTNGELDGTERRISDKENFLAGKQADLRNFNQELEEENAAFEEATAFYEDVRSQLEKEQAVANDTKGLLSNAGFAASVSKNLGF